MTTATTATPYIDDIHAQPDALRRQAESDLPVELKSVDLHTFDRIILSGMGSSDFAAIPVERELAARGLPVTRVDAGQLLDIPERVTGNTLLWMTSQSGRSGEVVAVAERLRGANRPALFLGTTDDETSPLAEASDILLPLHSGDEATVSTKSYLNTLASHERVLAAFRGDADAAVVDDIHRTAEDVSTLLEAWPTYESFAQKAWNASRARFAYIGIGDDASTALTGALITKESSKVPVEGFIGGNFRHGPLELAGEGLTAVLFGPGSDDDAFLPALARDLLSSGATVATVGPAAYADSQHFATPENACRLTRLAVGAVRTQLLTLSFSKATGEVAGRFKFGNKITAAL